MISDARRDRPLEENAALWKTDNQPEASEAACRQWARLSLLYGAGRDCVESDNLTSLWNKFRARRMVQGTLCSWITSAANFPFLLPWVCYVFSQCRGWMWLDNSGGGGGGEFNLSGYKQRATLFENLGRLHSLAHCLCNVLFWILRKVTVFLCGLKCPDQTVLTITVQLKWLFLFFCISAWRMRFCLWYVN